MRVGDRIRDCLWNNTCFDRGKGTIIEIVPFDEPDPDSDIQHLNYYCVIRWDEPLDSFSAWSEDLHISKDYLNDIELLEYEE
tara:strand:- start:1987 stop:2232 length:246 start_codon:yes stop_codon:yes gene_type:complete